MQRLVGGQEGQEGHVRQPTGWCSPIMEGSYEASGSGSYSGPAQEEGSARNSHVPQTGCKSRMSLFDQHGIKRLGGLNA